MAMNPEIKAQWVAALRSGKYTQGAGQLHRRPVGGPDEFCCLGVLCDLAVRSGVDILVADPDADSFGVAYYGTEFETLPSAVTEWAGLTNDNPDVTYVDEDGYENELDVADLNDRGHSFADLADLIEDQL